MATGYVLYNKKAGDPNTWESVKSLNSMISDQLEFIDVLDIADYDVFLSKLQAEDYVILAGGDGTVNRFINYTRGIEFKNEVLYFPNGSGNDFARDLDHKKDDEPFVITEYIKRLPSVEVDGKTYHFINGVGYGIDGYCCEVGDRLKNIQGKKVNYTAIAIKGLLFHYKPTNATVTVDGVTRSYKKVWLAPTMFGRYYGGGMMPTPAQSREDKEEKLSTLIFYGSGKLKSLMVFPSIFKGEHVKHTKMTEVLSGHEITVSFDRPVALQIDGETILGVSSYTARSTAKEPVNV